MFQVTRGQIRLDDETRRKPRHSPRRSLPRTCPVPAPYYGAGPRSRSLVWWALALVVDAEFRVALGMELSGAWRVDVRANGAIAARGGVTGNVVYTWSCLVY